MYSTRGTVRERSPEAISRVNVDALARDASECGLACGTQSDRVLCSRSGLRMAVLATKLALLLPDYIEMGLGSAMELNLPSSVLAAR